jgi:hypothetical protein
VQPVLTLAARHFRQTQNPDGSWPYNTAGGARAHPSNTCAGLLALAVEQGLADVERAPGEDGAGAGGLRFLGETVHRAPPPRSGTGHGFSGVDAVYDPYFFWSLERTAAIYDLRVIGDREWYPWAAERLVDAQEPDGSWQNGCPARDDTCFALLVLRRTNLTPDLTAALQKRPPEGAHAGPGRGPSVGAPAQPPPVNGRPPAAVNSRPTEGQAGAK